MWPMGLLFGHIVGKVVLKYYIIKQENILLIWMILLYVRVKTEAVWNVDNQNEIADFIGIEVHHNCSTLNYCNTRSHGSYEIWVFRQRARMIRNLKG